MVSPGISRFQLAYQVSPIILTNGIATNLPGGILPIISLTDAASFGNPVFGNNGILENADTNIDLNDFFAQYIPLPGSELINQDVGHYPFANQAVAANAVIQSPLKVSFRMVCPVREPGGYGNKPAIITALKASLDQHNQSGGTYTLATPSFIYANALMLSFRDVSSGESKQANWAWQLDFEIPLLTEEQAEQALSSFMQKATNGTAFNGPPAWSSVENTLGFPPTLAGSSVIPAAQAGNASNTSVPQPPSPVSP
jgi:hypothetical protein